MLSFSRKPAKTGIRRNSRRCSGILKRQSMTPTDQTKTTTAPTMPAQPMASSDQSMAIGTLEPSDPQMPSDDESSREEAWVSWEARMAAKKKSL